MARNPVPDLRRLIDRTLQRFEPLAPDWFVRVVAPKQAPVPWANMVRFALSVAVPLLVGVAIGQGGLGGFAGMGALLGAFGDAGGPFSARFRRTGLGVIAGIVGLLAGRLLLTQGPIAIPVVGLFGAVSAFVSAVNAEFSFAGLQLLIYLAIASGPARAVPPGALLVAFLIGAGWSILLSFVQTRIVREPDRPPLAVGAVLDAVLDLIRHVTGTFGGSGGEEELTQARRRVTVAIGRAYDVIADARAHSPGSRADLRRLAGVLAAVAQLAAVTTQEVRAHPGELAAAAPDLEALRTSIVTGKRRLPARLRTPEDLATRSALTRAIAQLDRAGDDGAASIVGIGRRPLGAVLTELFSGTSTWLFAARLALTLMAAEALTLLLPIPRPYWLLLTTAVVLKPDFGSIFARGVQRTLGTLIGVLVGAVVVELVPAGPLLLIPVAVFAFLFPFGASRNFGMLSTFLTPLTLILVDFGGAGTKGLAADRLLDTVLGAAVVLLVGYLPWPSTWRPDLAAQVAKAIDALAHYARVAFARPSAEVVPARRRAYAALSDVRSNLQGALAEPTPRARQASAWFPLVAQLERTADDLRDASILGKRLAERSPAEDGERIAAALAELAAAIREHRQPKTVSVPEAGLLATVGADVESARRVVAGADA
ncbi:FUSC family protein [Amnibacterium sp. CER49]|uniref:FUSC family protein n=1 Tax=Amnibacterium sp. CER49 TaxID=3039161 RepID=UPI00244D6C69|nr:FUSC family protein [Amnibacterium sp. CER49]MDH2444584.1 FUSC family protein [Amnibacterium sp. CER49]